MRPTEADSNLAGTALPLLEQKPGNGGTEAVRSLNSRTACSTEYKFQDIRGYTEKPCLKNTKKKKKREKEEGSQERSQERAMGAEHDHGT